MSPGFTPACEVLKEDVGAAVEEDEARFDSFGGGTIFFRLSGGEIPCLYRRIRRAMERVLRKRTQPRSEKAPRNRPSVKIPYMRKIPPLIKCARPLKTRSPI